MKVIGPYQVTKDNFYYFKALSYGNINKWLLIIYGCHYFFSSKSEAIKYKKSCRESYENSTYAP